MGLPHLLHIAYSCIEDKKGRTRGYAHTSGSNIGRTQEYARTLFDNQFLHGGAAHDAVGVDAGSEVVDNGVAAATDRHAAHHATLHVIDGKGGGLIDIIADVHIALGGVGVGGEDFLSGGFGDADGSGLHAEHNGGRDAAVGDSERIDTVGLLDGSRDVDIDGEGVVDSIGCQGETAAGEAADTLAIGADAPSLDAVFLNGSEACR